MKHLFHLIALSVFALFTCAVTTNNAKAQTLIDDMARFMNDPVTHADVLKAAAELNGGVRHVPLLDPPFADVPSNKWYSGYMNEAAIEEWYLGANNCLKSTKPCNALPEENADRSMVASVLVKAFDAFPRP